MRFATRFAFPVALSVGLSASAIAQPMDSVFADYDEMRRVMDSLVMDRNIQDLMIRFGGADEMTIQQLNSLDAQVEQLYPEDFRNVAVMRREQHESGFRQELLVYWTGLSYLYAYVLMHDRGDDVVSINFRFNSDFNQLNSLF